MVPVVFASVVVLNVHAAEKLLAIPEMLARAGSLEVNDAVYINDQRLEFQLLHAQIGANGAVERRYRQLFRGIPIWQELIFTTFAPLANNPRVAGHIIAKIDDDIDLSLPTLSEDEIEALVKKALEHHDFVDVSAGLSATQTAALRSGHPPSIWIVLGEDAKAYLAFELCFLLDGAAASPAEHDSSAIRALVDAHSGEIRKLWHDKLESVLNDQHMQWLNQAWKTSIHPR